MENLGSRWTLERVICSADTNEAVAEWTHWKTKAHSALRGDEWYLFDDQSGLITEIRAFYAAPAGSIEGISELFGYDYASSGYATTPPFRPE